MRRLRGADTWSVAALSFAFVAVYLLDSALDLGWTEDLATRPEQVGAALDAIAAGTPSGETWLALSTLLTSAFAHADALHLGTNLVFFWLFGSLLVRVAGNRWLLATFALTSVTAASAFVARHLDSALPVSMIGASGAISGVAGAYCVLALRWDVPNAYAWPLAHPIPPLHAAAVAALSALSDIFTLAELHGMSDGVARDAHLGGFAGGIVLAMLLTTFFPDIRAFKRSWLGGGRG